MADNKNAHIRQETPSRRQDKDILAEEAKRILDDPAFQRGFNAVRDGLISAIENSKSDGGQEQENYERELCRSLRTLNTIKRNISLGIQGQTLRLANYQATKGEE